jgi:hypothetical protein
VLVSIQYLIYWFGFFFLFIVILIAVLLSVQGSFVSLLASTSFLLSLSLLVSPLPSFVFKFSRLEHS